MWSSQCTPGEKGRRRVDAARLRRLGFFIRLLFFGFFLFGFLPGGFLPNGHGGIGLFVFRLLLRGFPKFVDEHFLFFFALGAFGDVALAVEENAAIDQGLLHDGVSAQGVAIVNRQVGVFSDINRANALVDAELYRRIQRNHLQRFVMREAAELHALGGFLIQVRGFFGVVGI